MEILLAEVLDTLPFGAAQFDCGGRFFFQNAKWEFPKIWGSNDMGLGFRV